MYLIATERRQLREFEEIGKKRFSCGYQASFFVKELSLIPGMSMIKNEHDRNYGASSSSVSILEKVAY